MLLILKCFWNPNTQNISRPRGRVMWSSDSHGGTRPGGRVVSWSDEVFWRVICWGREASTRPGDRVVWHDQVRFFQLARQQLQITWKQHKYATCMQNYPKHANWWQMMRNGIKQWWYDAKVMTNGCSKQAKCTLIKRQRLGLKRQTLEARIVRVEKKVRAMESDPF